MYDLQTDGGWFVADGLIVSNCTLIPDLEKWLPPTLEPRSPTEDFPSWRRDLPPELQALGERDGRRWAFPAERRRMLDNLLDDYMRSDTKAVDRTLKDFWSYIRGSVESAGMKLQSKGIRYNWDSGIAAPNGIKKPDCYMTMNLARLADWTREAGPDLAKDSFTKTFIHEMLHSRGWDDAAFQAEYLKAPGYEEGSTELLARRLWERWTGKLPVLNYTYTVYVETWEGVAGLLGLESEAMVRSLMSGAATGTLRSTAGSRLLTMARGSASASRLRADVTGDGVLDILDQVMQPTKFIVAEEVHREMMLRALDRLRVYLYGSSL